MTITISMAFLIIAAYLIGNISPSILIARSKKIDIRNQGSGNAGTTNALRVLGKKAAIGTLIIDVLKGVVAVLIGGYFGGTFTAELCALAVFLGHVWPIMFGFRGGKGVATTFGALMGLNPILGLSALGVVAIGVILTKRMSAGSIIGAIAVPIISIFVQPTFVIPGAIMGALVIFKHRANIVRIIQGKEPVLFGKNKTKKER